MQRTDLIIAAVIGVSLLAGVTAAAEQPERLSAAEQFQSQIEPFVKQYCADCHNDADREGDLSLASISHDFRDAQQTATWSGMLDMLELGEMPPKEAKQPPGKEQALVMDWIRIELGHAGVERDATLLARPEYGNYVDHDKLFDGSVSEKPYTMPRLWRVRSENYPITPPPVSDEGADYAALREADEPTAQRLMALSEEIGKVLTAHVLGEEGINPHRTLGRQLRRANVYHRLIEDAEVYTNDQPLSRELVVVDVGTLFERILLRQPSEEETDRYAGLMLQIAEQTGSKKLALQALFRALLMTPEAIYRQELGLGQPDEHGRRMLSEAELSVAVPAALVAGPFDPVDGLKTRADVEAAVRNLIEKQTKAYENRKYQTPQRYLDFFRQYFGYVEAEDVFKDNRVRHHATVGTPHLPPILVEDTDYLIAHILREDKHVLRELLSTDRLALTWADRAKERRDRIQWWQANSTFNWHMDTIPNPGVALDRPLKLEERHYNVLMTYLAYYGVDPFDKQVDDAKPNEPLVVRASTPRAGVLTQPSWLLAHSTFTDNQVIQRGEWVRTHLLGGTVPDVPVGVEAAVPPDEDKGLRERLAITREQYCWRCHQKMDPLGYPFEAYDDFGRFRDRGEEYMLNGEWTKLDTSGAISGSGDAKVDGDVKDAVDMLHRLAESDRVRQVFIRHVFRYFLGRNETLADSQTLIAADKAYVESGGSFNELVVSLLTSDSFLYRKDPAAGKPNIEILNPKQTRNSKLE